MTSDITETLKAIETSSSTALDSIVYSAVKQSSVSARGHQPPMMSPRLRRLPVCSSSLVLLYHFFKSRQEVKLFSNLLKEE